MANQNQATGFAPVRYRSGAPWNGAVNLYTYLAAETVQVWIGDPVATISIANGDGFGTPAVKLAVAGASVRGIVVGIGTFPQGGPYINPNNLTLMTRPVNAQASNYYFAVVDDPDVLFEVQEAGAGSVLTATSINRNANFNLGTRTASLVLSPTFLDNNTVNTTSTLNCKIFGSAQRPDNTPFTTFQKWLVSINNHDFSTGTTSI
jgi:hypothetical protein